MYRPDKSAHSPPPLGLPTPQGPFRFKGPCSVPPPGHFPPGPCRLFSASAPNSHHLHNRPPTGHFITPHCSSFSIDRSTTIALGSSQQIVHPAEPPHLQVPQWNPTPVEHYLPDNSDQAGEEFLRCIAANKPLPDYLKGNMAYNLADAFKSANVLKKAVKSDPEFQKHMARSKSCSRSRSRGRSCDRSRAKSRARSKSRAHSRSRGRSKSNARGKTWARSKCRSHSRSRSQSRSKKKSHGRSTSRVRRSKSQSNSSENSYGKDKKRKRSPGHNSSSVGSSNNLTGKSLLEGLKLVMNSKELEERLPTLKDAILTVQASDESKNVECVSDEHTCQQHDREENSASLENDNMLLPHDRVGSDFSWLQGKGQEDVSVQKADELEDEESFLYGNQASSQTGQHAKLQEIDSLALGSQQHHQNNSLFSSCGELLDLKQPLQMTSSALAFSSLASMECEKIKNILQSLGASSDVSETMVKMQGQKEGKEQCPALLCSNTTAASLALSNPNVQQALESLQSLIKATKEKRTKSDGTSQTSSNKQKAGDNEERKREKQVRISKMESLAKELEELFKQDGLGFLTPVTGFYCHKCEEFIGDLNSADNHAVIHCHSNSSILKVQNDTHATDSKGHSRYYSTTSNCHPHPSDRRDHRDYSYHKVSGDHSNSRDDQRNWRDERDHRSKYHNDHRSHRAGQEIISLKEEMRKERMLITVSRGLTPAPPNIRVKEEVNKGQAIGSHGKIKVEDANRTDKSSKESRENDSKEKAESSDSSDDDKGKLPKTKLRKTKKKKKEKKKKKKRDKS